MVVVTAMVVAEAMLLVVVVRWWWKWWYSGGIGNEYNCVRGRTATALYYSDGRVVIKQRKWLQYSKCSRLYLVFVT